MWLPFQSSKAQQQQRWIRINRTGIQFRLLLLVRGACSSGYPRANMFVGGWMFEPAQIPFKYKHHAHTTHQWRDGRMACSLPFNSLSN